MIILQNKGLIELDFIKTMGVNVKEDDNAIGFFGTGLKYAIAVFLREEIDLKLFIGLNEYEFVTERKVLRGKEFDFCRMIGPMDSIDLGFTTELGKNWELWQAYREIHSNCMDEGGKIYSNDSVLQNSDHTTFSIGDINTDGIFIDKDEKNLLFSNDQIEIYEGDSDKIYYKGIRAKDLHTNSIYTYNIIKNCDLTEDRLLAYDYQIEYIISDAVATMDKPEVIKSIITAKNNFESSINMDLFCNKKPGETLTKVHAENEDDCILNAIGYMNKHKPVATLSPEETKRLAIEQIKDICNDNDFTFSSENESIKIYF